MQQEDKLQDALACYQKALALDPKYVVAYNDTGIVLEALGEPEAAEEMYLKAIEIAPDYPNTYANLALLYEEQKDYTQAVVYWVKRVMVGSPSDTWTGVAKKRIEDIARVYPEAYQAIEQSYVDSLEEAQTGESAGQMDILVKAEPAPVSLLEEPPSLRVDNKTRALEHLKNAKGSFSRGQYVSALKEATVAEYLDPSNEEVSVFVAQVRNKILK